MTLEELGTILRNERKKQALSIDDVSTILKIGARLLRALEEGDIASLPHPTYTRGFIRSYASFLGLAAEEINSVVIPAPQDDAVTARLNVHPPEASKKTVPKNRMSAIALLIVAAGALAVVWPVYMTLNTSPPQLAQPSPPADQSQSQPPPQKMPQVADDTQKSSRAPVQENDSGPAEMPVAAPAPPPSAPVAQNRPADPDATQTKPFTHNVIITAVEECWIYSRADGTGARQFSLRKGDTFALTFQKTLDIKLGNAGGVRIRYDGRDMPAPGQSGQVRTLRFPPRALQE
ncbi:MAG: DUF4115 domain-containing protein [Desulfovibrio sp.]|jgi:cytoskeleton protein RodZ|nr:DUF4115 domain-containing protein [Desulfovibrio sp.]